MSRYTVAEVLGLENTRLLWTGNYEKVLPISIQDFDLSAILPAVFYMFRFGSRRGSGRFQATFATGETGKGRTDAVTIEQVAAKLSGGAAFAGFDSDVGQAILGDLLLCYCLENGRQAPGRREKIQRVAPAHYLASWLDLPYHVGNLRYVPEMMVAMLANQREQFIPPNKEGERTWFAVGLGFEQNPLLRAFGRGMQIRGERGSRTSDRFDEDIDVGIDELLMIRLAQQLGQAPDKLRGKEGGEISNQWPIARRAAEHFSEDIRRFVRGYAGVVPRRAFIQMLESCMAVGLITILNSVIALQLEWLQTGEIRKKCDQQPPPLFVDASNGIDRQLRRLSEQCYDDFLRRAEQFPVALMTARLLDFAASKVRSLKEQKTRPDATEWLNLLGSLLHGRHEEADRIHKRIEEDAEHLAEKLREENPSISEGLFASPSGHSNVVVRMAEVLCQLMPVASLRKKLHDCAGSCLHINQPNGLAAKRRILESDFGAGKKTREIRSIVLTDAVLDYLVHRHLLPNKSHQEVRSRSLRNFLRILRERYGFYVDEPVPGMSISNGLLQANRWILDRRLRDLGLLTGVNDTEAMKRLRPRFDPRGGAHDAAD